MAQGEASQTPPIRKDLEIVPQYFGGRVCYVVKDPVAATYFRIGEVERVVLQCFQEGRDVEATREEVKRRTDAEISVADIYRFVEQLKRYNILRSKSMADGRALALQRAQQRRNRIKQVMSNYLFMTIPVWDPDKLLNRLLPWVRWIFHPLVLVAWAGIALAALWIVIDNFAVLAGDALRILSGWNLLILSVTVFAIKFVHELGHALTCKYFGGEVHAIGPAFLVFQPCMFTDTSDAWLFPSKWDRMKVSGAGILTELMLAAVAAFVWVSSEPGMVKQVAYTVTIAASVSTVLFNANPLLRYDGYYLLSDLIEIPNLRLRVGGYLGYLFRRYMMGLREDSPVREPRERLIFLVYGTARFVYILFLSFAIGLFLYTIFQPLGLFTWTMSGYGIIVMPLIRQGREVTRHYKGGSIRKRYLVASAILLAGLAAVWFIPIDYTIEAPCVVAPQRFEVVRAAVPGRLAAVRVARGEAVRAGDVLARIENRDLALRIARTRAELRSVEARLRQALAGSMAAYAVERRKREILTGQLAELEAVAQRRLLRAPFDGVVTGLRAEEAGVAPAQSAFLEASHGDVYHELDVATGVTVAAGSGILGVADMSRFEFRVFVYERDIARLARGMTLRCVLRADPTAPMETTVGAIIPVDVKTLENVGITLADVGYIPVRPGAEGAEPLVTLYMVRGEAPPDAARLRPGQTGKARIVYGSGPIGAYYFNRLVRGLRLRLQEAAS
jgi:putative peptide zinc metalloprotease protein